MSLTTEQRLEGLEELVKPLPVRIGTLEDKVHQLETWAGPGQNEGLSRNIIAFRKETNRKLDGLTKDVAELKTNVAGLQTDVAELKTNVAGLQTDVAELKTNVAGLQTDVAELKTDVAELKTNLADFTVEVRGALAEILDRLPPNVAGALQDGDAGDAGTVSSSRGG
jgi:chromosome segregation ATPase